MKIDQQNRDLLLVMLLAVVVGAWVVFFPSAQSPLRVVLAFLALLALPGYALTLVLFPRRSDLDFADRLILCLGLSVPVIVLVGVVLNYSPFGIRPASVAVGMAIATVLLGGMALWRRSRVALVERFIPELRPSAVQVVWVASFALMAFVVYWVARPNERFTEFYVLGPQGGLENYARQLRPGEEFTVTLVLRNFERRRMEYRLRVPFDPSIGELRTPVIANEGTWARTLRLKAPAGSGQTQLSFDLYRLGDSTPYRQLYLRVDLRSDTQP
jgi:uncharacterized membrane protein